MGLITIINDRSYAHCTRGMVLLISVESLCQRSRSHHGRTISVSGFPHATSSNASFEVSGNQNGICLESSEVDDGIGSERCGQSPATIQGSLIQLFLFQCFILLINLATWSFNSHKLQSVLSPKLCVLHCLSSYQRWQL
ncbi:hypothetical protein VNO80_00530 [Phaseolus coccineus]|uniref:Uncharacterized protein n=1 Tax=Phaseolus coccineus TaxID=3886 RepID=A0AAN9RM85_PHACN